MTRNRLVLFLIILSVVLGACTPAATPTAAPTAAATKAPAAVATAVPTAAPAKPTTPPAAPTVAPTAAPAAPTPAVKPPSSGLLRLATTTSTADTGLLTAILPIFEKANNVKVDVVAVGSGQAIEIGSKGDADVLLVHSRAAEDKFVADGHAKARFDVMYNDFILVGPKEDPAKAASTAAAKDAFKAIMDTKAIFVSRGDKSGTNTKELGIWTTLGITPTKEMTWYNSIGQGMGDTLLFSNEKKGYTLTDRGTWLAMRDKLPGLVIVLGGNTLAENKDKSLLNPYGVLAVDPVKHPGVNSDLAAKFVTWITSVDAQKAIAAFGVDKYGQQLFYPDSADYKKTLPTTAAPALTITGLVGAPQSLTMDALNAMQVVNIKAEHPKTGMQDYTGVRLNALLDLAKPAASATKLVMTSSDGFAAEVALADVRKTTDALLAITAGKLNAVMPGMASNLWSKDVIKLEIK